MLDLHKLNDTDIPYYHPYFNSAVGYKHSDRNNLLHVATTLTQENRDLPNWGYEERKIVFDFVMDPTYDTFAEFHYIIQQLDNDLIDALQIGTPTSEYLFTMLRDDLAPVIQMGEEFFSRYDEVELSETPEELALYLEDQNHHLGNEDLGVVVDPDPIVALDNLDVPYLESLFAQPIIFNEARREQVESQYNSPWDLTRAQQFSSQVIGFENNSRPILQITADPKTPEAARSILLNALSNEARFEPHSFSELPIALDALEEAGLEEYLPIVGDFISALASKEEIPTEDSVYASQRAYQAITGIWPKDTSNEPIPEDVNRQRREAEARAEAVKRNVVTDEFDPMVLGSQQELAHAVARQPDEDVEPLLNMSSVAGSPTSELDENGNEPVLGSLEDTETGEIEGLRS